MISLPQLDTQTLTRIGAAIAVVLALILLWRWYRRRQVAAALLAAVTGGSFEYQRDVLVPDGQGGWVHVDFLLLTARGCIVIDLRDVAGNIFGGDQMDSWTVMHHGQRTTFANPQTGLYDRIAVVRALVSELPIEGRVVFSLRGQFPKGLPRYTMMIDSVVAEFPGGEQHAGAAPRDTWRADWQKLVKACKPSSLVDPKRAI